ncbi:hypothetical protein FACS189490_07130 [Clostridia bacterium]|nr:hypothetical protein FACS189490_07130 [Clostridia bacterium]
MEELYFSLNNSEVAPGRQFPALSTPTVTFNRNVAYVNAAAMKRLPAVDYVLFMVDREARKLSLRPCGEDERDAVRWRSSGKNTSKPKHIICEEFSRRLYEFMKWDVGQRFKLRGNFLSSDSEIIIVFDLTIPADGDFGVMYEEHRNNPLMKKFTEDSMIEIKNIE